MLYQVYKKKVTKSGSVAHDTFKVFMERRERETRGGTFLLRGRNLKNCIGKKTWFSDHTEGNKTNANRLIYIYKNNKILSSWTESGTSLK